MAINSHGYEIISWRENVSMVQGLGKRKVCGDTRNQHDSTDLISWRDGLDKPVTNSQSSSSFRDQEVLPLHVVAAANSSPPETMKKFQVVTKSTFRRFPHKHCLPRQEHWKVSTQTCSWFRDHYATPLHVLAVTQLPFAKKSSWNYSYKFP